MKNSVLKYLLCLNTLVLVLSLKKDGDNVYLLNADNLEKSVEFLDSLLVVFYSPNCQSCRDFETMLPKIGKFVQFIQCLKTTQKSLIFANHVNSQNLWLCFVGPYEFF